MAYEDNFDFVSLPGFTQSFATTISPGDPSLPEISLVLMPTDADTEIDLSIRKLNDLFGALKDENYDADLELRDFRQGDKQLVVSSLALHLKSGFRSQFQDNLDLPNYEKLASDITETALIPVRYSPLQGRTFASLIGGSGSVSLLEVFHTGVSPAEAVVSVLFVAGAMIVFGAANAVRRAVEAGVEYKLLAAFWVKEEKVIAASRDFCANRETIRKPARVSIKSRTKEATSRAPEKHEYRSENAGDE
jgi:hypothetical protein